MSGPTADLDRSVHEAALALGRPLVAGELADLVRVRAPLLDATATAAAVRRVQARMHGLGVLDPLLADDAVTDVLVNGPGPVWVERRGRVEPTTTVLDADEVRHLVERVVTPLGLRADRRTPLVDARLPDGSRVHVAMPPLAVDGPYLTIRRFAARTLPVGDFADDDVAALLVDAVRRRRNVVVVGGTGAGKTTLLNALCQHLDPGERVVTVEDAAELRLPGDHVVRLEARTASPDGVDAVTIRDLVRNALRMRPDRIVVGEVRGGEALDMLQAMNTGHDGSLSTCHANGPAQALRRLETMALTAGVDLPLRAVRDQLCSAVDLLVQVTRRPDGARRIVAVDRVVDDPDARQRTVPLLDAGRVREAA
ncbi:MAG: CpaF family protein [Acidimicrobiia bacterium]